jgi:FHA domain-containing protein/uncharacterized protein DUF1707
MEPTVSSVPDARVSTAEREQIASRLKDACAEDRLSLQTFASRLEVLYAARTRGEVQALVADLPQLRPLERSLVRVAGWAAGCATVVGDAWGRATAPRLLVPSEGSVVIGRSRGCGCVITDDTVSRRHAKLTRTTTGWTLRDLASSNGTYVNGARITDTASVRPGDEVGFGLARFRLVRPN